MNNLIKDWNGRIDVVTEKVLDSCKPLDDNSLNWKPSPDTWSIGQVLDHLMIINETYYPVLNEYRAGTMKLPFIARLNFIVNFFGTFILKSVEPERRKKMKTFPIWEPSQSDIDSDIVDKFPKHQGELKKTIEASEDLITGGAIIHSPANKSIVYKLEKAFEIIVSHEERHLNQILELIENLPK